MHQTPLERLGAAFAAMPATAFYLGCCLAVIVLTVAGEALLTVAGVPESQILSALAPTIPILGILLVSLRTSAATDQARERERAEVARRVEEVIARARSIGEVFRIMEGDPRVAVDSHRLARWEAVSGALDGVARRTGDPADVEAARQMAELLARYRTPAPTDPLEGHAPEP